MRSLRTVVLIFALICGFGVLPDVARAQEYGSITLDIYTCDTMNDPIDPNQTLIDACNMGTDDIVFTLDMIPSHGGSAMASTGTGGAPATISFSQLTGGNYRMTRESVETIGLSFIAQCTSDIREFDSPFFPFAIIEPDGRLTITLLPGEHLGCDWYNVVQVGAHDSARTTSVR